MPPPPPLCTTTMSNGCQEIILVNAFVLFQLEVLAAASVVRITSLLFSLPRVSRVFFTISWVVYSSLKDGGKGIGEAVCSWTRFVHCCESLYAMAGPVPVFSFVL